jgi:dihydroneopterin aldolase
VSDRIILADMVFQGRHGLHEQEQRQAQPFEVDVEMALNLQPAGIDDDIDKTVDYGQVFDVCRQIVESTSFRLLEALAEAIAHEILAAFPVSEVTIRVRKPKVPIEGTLAFAGVEIQRQRSNNDRGR